MSLNWRFAVGIRSVRSRAALAETTRRYADAGFGVLNVPDHLGAPAPFPVLAAAAQASETMRVGTYVLNVGFYKPALLARDIADLHTVSGGRFDAGLGAGYVREEFEAAELPFPSAGERVGHLERVTAYLKRHTPDVPIMIAGNGDRVLRLAARHADIIGLTGADVGKDTADPLAERIGYVRAAAGERFAEVVLDMAITAAPARDETVPDLTLTRQYAPGASDEQLLARPSVLSGTPAEAADKVRMLRETYGITSFSVQKNHADYFAAVIGELR
ncbi:TIGR03621 family F420-dependent LLM class oxidoreductase [Mycolicibacterium palauense]|uniref:TIGR03621 family F420-dependent LLM class oxidoreductase n=1 Tax=Mycolicibacterium palauense TaxID=2034511 RepID=UPI000BFEB1CD|nr:TIGR03621 family F420-dependent LLM class oxidoreductase [Mycolicibacterium palauense]